MNVKSMTGYGKSICVSGEKRISIEIKAVNSKQFDFSIRCPNIYKEKELEIRNEIIKTAERGKVDCILNIENNKSDSVVAIQINKSIVKDYYQQIKELATDLGLPINEQLLTTALRLPETMKSEIQAIEQDEWDLIFSGIKQALDEFVAFRLQEGAALAKDILMRIDSIEKNLIELQKYENSRIDKIRERLNKNLTEFIPAASVDNNRFEQEIIYFLERLDITEEKVRLKNHCEYFKKTIKEDSSGRKLGFITQEIGREINTIGSKASDTDMQKHVVEMKDELEKIKEQLLNIL